MGHPVYFPNYNEHNQINGVLDSLASKSFIPLMLQPTRITSHSNTLIDKMFSNVLNLDLISGNLTATISDHLPQFEIIHYIKNNIKNTWKGTKSLISLKTVASHVPTVMSLDNGDTITNPDNIAKIFNNYFASIAETTKKKA